MNEHLFKLKKNGKTVGYMHLLGAYAHYKTYLFEENWRSQRLFENLPEINTSVINLTTHPFVTKDKNGKDVFAGDRIKRVTAEGCPNPSRKVGREGIVVWHHGFLQWSLKVGTEKSYLMEDLADSEIFEAEIELIEEKEDE